MMILGIDDQGLYLGFFHFTMNTFESNSGLFFKPIKTHKFFNFGGSLRIITK